MKEPTTTAAGLSGPVILVISDSSLPGIYRAGGLIPASAGELHTCCVFFTVGCFTFSHDVTLFRLQVTNDDEVVMVNPSLALEPPKNCMYTGLYCTKKKIPNVNLTHCL